MDILTAMTDVAIGECQLNMDNLGIRTWTVFAARDCQALLDAAGDSTRGDNETARKSQPLRRNNTSTEPLQFRSSPVC